jgi:hypothetical protein
MLLELNTILHPATIHWSRLYSSKALRLLLLLKIAICTCAAVVIILWFNLCSNANLVLGGKVPTDISSITAKLWYATDGFRANSNWYSETNAMEVDG